MAVFTSLIAFSWICCFWSRGEKRLDGRKGREDNKLSGRRAEFSHGYLFFLGAVGLSSAVMAGLRGGGGRQRLAGQRVALGRRRGFGRGGEEGGFCEAHRGVCHLGGSTGGGGLQLRSSEQDAHVEQSPELQKSSIAIISYIRDCRRYIILSTKFNKLTKKSESDVISST